MANNDSNIGRQIGSYRLISLINSGSFGNVYQGRHLIFHDDPIVAIKLLNTTLPSPQEREEFVKEAQVLRKFHHPHILRILDAGFQDRLPFLVTEYAEGGSLRERLRQAKSQPLPLDEALRTLTQIGQALYYAHEQNTVHRDLKPENILFNSQREVLLADFGISVILASTRTGIVGLGGTPAYMAPEQFEGLASPKSDQYSLGCIAYELVTGHQLYSIPSPSLEAYWYHHAKVEPTPPTTYQPHLPAHIEQAILTALAKDRTKRYSDIATFSQALSKSGKKRIEEADVIGFVQRAMRKHSIPMSAGLRPPLGLQAQPAAAGGNLGIDVSAVHGASNAQQPPQPTVPSTPAATPTPVRHAVGTQANPPSRAVSLPKPEMFKAMIEMYKSIREGNITDPETIFSLAARFNAIAQDPEASKAFDYDAARAASNLYQRARVLKAAEAHRGNGDEITT